MSLPVRGAWIEIACPRCLIYNKASLPVRGAWIEIRREVDKEKGNLSLPVRGAWIEIVPVPPPGAHGPVAPRKGSVD